MIGLSLLLACGALLLTPLDSRAQQPVEKKRPAQSRQAGPRRSGASATKKEPRTAERRPKGRQSEPRDRWASLPAEKRKQLQSIYSQLKALPADKRKLLLERLRKLDASARRERIRAAKKRVESDEDLLDRQSRQTRRRMLESLPWKVRQRLLQLPAKERQKHLQQVLASRRATLIANLPPHVAIEIRGLPPAKQAQRLKQYRTGQIFRRTFQNREEVNRLKKLPRRELRRLLAVRGERDTAPPRPEYLSERTWRRWVALKPYERGRVLRWIRTGGDLGTGPTSPGREALQRRRTSAPRDGKRKNTKPAPAGPTETRGQAGSDKASRSETRRRPGPRAPRTGSAPPRHSPTSDKEQGK